MYNSSFECFAWRSILFSNVDFNQFVEGDEIKYRET